MKNPNSIYIPALNLFTILYQKMLEMRAVGDELILKFDFGSEKSALLEVPAVEHWVLESAYADPYLVHPNNVIRQTKTDARKFVLNHALHFKMNKHGIESVRDGDIYLKQVFKFNAGIKTELRRNHIHLDSSRRPVLLETEDGLPIIQHGHYVPRTANYWIVVTVLKQETWIPLPDF